MSLRKAWWDELDDAKIKDLLKLKYNNAIADALTELGQPDQVRRVFVGFQRHLCEPQGSCAWTYRRSA